MNRPELPRTLQSLGTLRLLNILAVGFALAALTSAIPAAIGHEGMHLLGVLFGLPTLLCGVIWARVLRIRKTIGRSRFRWAWLLSVPLAAMNGGLACAALFAVRPTTLGDVIASFLLGASFGAIVWIPSLIATLVLFGLPIARSHSLAAKGLAGEERGERFLGIVTASLSVVSLLLVSTTTAGSDTTRPVLDFVGLISMWALAAAGLLSGGLAAFLSHLRTKRRRAFVADVEAGNVTGFRVAETPEGRVLMRITSMGEGYRVANFEEPVVEDSPLSDDPQRLALR